MDAEKTNLTEKTILVSNNDFMAKIFQNSPEEVNPIVVSRSASSKMGGWTGKPWNSLYPEMLSTNNNYFSLSTYRPNEKKQYSRRKENFQSLHAVMLDDIGTKVSMEALTLPPSWLIETSEGNFQVGYIFKEPVTNPDIADQLMEAIIKKGICDPGADGPCTRLVRLPNGTNSKYSPGFETKLHKFSPDLRYSLQELVDGFGLNWTSDPKQTISKPEHKSDTIIEPSTETDGNSKSDEQQSPESAVLVALKARGLYKRDLGDGKHEMICPWLDEHTEKIDSGSVYYEPSKRYLWGGYKCHHSHCKNRSVKSLHLNLGLGFGKIPILVEKGELHRITEEAEKVLAEAEDMYQFGQCIVQVTTDPSTKQTKISPVPMVTLELECSRLITWFKTTEDDIKVVDPPKKCINILFGRQDYKYLRILRSVVQQPYFYKDRLVNQPGYDSETQIMGVFNQKDFQILECPKKEDAAKALQVLSEPFQEFEFDSPEDFAATLLAVQTAVIRSMLPTAPMFNIHAHSPGSGKSYLCSILAAIATTQNSNPTSFPSNDEECNKVLIAALMNPSSPIIFDNLNVDIFSYGSLCTALTSETISGRLLGQSKMVTVSTRILILANGNNIRPLQDMGRRCIPIHLNPKDENLAQKKYSNYNLLETVRVQRNKYVTAALTIIQAWICAGKPKTDHAHFSGYPEFLEMCLQPLLWLGCPDPITLVQKSLDTDPVKELLGNLLVVWYKTFESSPTMLKQALLYRDIEEIFLEIAGERDSINRKRAGRWIKRNAGQKVNGLYFESSELKGASEYWTVKKVIQ